MDRNIEVKARVANLEHTRATLESISDGPCRVLDQEDTFFRTYSGRLKLRIESAGQGELIYYERPDVPALKESRYVRCAVPDPAGMRLALAAALGIEGVVRKRRLLYQVGQVRLHLDTVEGLGAFLEMEVVLTAEQTADEGQRIARELADRLRIAVDGSVPCAYVDLLRGDPHA